ncbi:MAG: glycosyltransferase family 87 protein, partial [Chloroflexota bacterium]
MVNDFIEYWSAVSLLLRGGNPYAPADLLATQTAVGWSQPVPLVMWNPPWTLSFLLPFGFFGFETAQFAWFLLHTLIIFHGAQLLWRIYQGDAGKSRIAWLSALTFAPTYFVLLLGQVGPLILLGLVGFVYFAKKNTWGTAGICLVLASVKPHLLYLLWLALLLDVCKPRSRRTLGGLTAAGFVVAVIPLLLNREIYGYYLELFGSDRVIRAEAWATPSLGVVVGELLAIEGNWIRWLPSAIGALWFLWHWSRRTEHWDWIRELPLLLLASVTTASFVWTFDYIILLPAVVQSAVWLGKIQRRSTRMSII